MDGTYSRHGEHRNLYKILVGKPEQKKPFGRQRHRSEDNIRTYIQEIGCGVNSSCPGQRPAVGSSNMVMKLRATLKEGNLSTN